MKNRLSYLFIFLAFMFAFTGIVTYTKKASAEEAFNIQSESAYLIDADTGSVIYSKNEEEKLPIASMCKVMTLLVCFEKVDSGVISLDDVIKVSENASKMGGSQIFLENNGEYSVDQLIKGIVVASANDACVAMAETLCGSEEAFVDEMNKKCQELSMENTVFVNCTGLPKEGQYSCAKDVSKMFSELLKHEDYFKYSTIWMDEIKHPKDRITQISNTNKLVRFYKGCIGGKTGYTSEAGHCLTACAKRDNTKLISVIIKAPNSKTRFNEASSLFNYGFANYCSKIILDKNLPIANKCKIKGGKIEEISAIPKENLYIFGKKSDKRSFEFVTEFNQNIKAPIVKGQSIGRIYVLENGVEIANVELVSNENVNEKNYYDNLKGCIDNWQLIG